MSAQNDKIGTILLLAVLGFISGLIWWSYDIVVSLRHGSWTALHFGDLLVKMGLGKVVRWVHHPDDWMGLRRLLKYVLDMSSCYVIMSISALIFFVGRKSGIKKEKV